MQLSMLMQVQDLANKQVVLYFNEVEDLKTKKKIMVWSSIMQCKCLIALLEHLHYSPQ